MMEVIESKLYQLHDAQGDMLKKLNHLTDCTYPTFKDVQAMYLYSKAIKELEETMCYVWKHKDGEAESYSAHDLDHKK